MIRARAKATRKSMGMAACMAACATTCLVVMHGCVVVSSTKTEGSNVNTRDRGASSASSKSPVKAGDAASRAAMPGASGAPLTTADVVGAWTLTDQQNNPFVLTVGANGKAVTNWSAGAAGAEGERGEWIIEKGELVVTYSDGWRDVLSRTTAAEQPQPAGEALQKRSFAPGADRNGASKNWGMAVRPAADVAPFVGTFKVSMPGGAPYFVSLDPDGAARATGNGPAVGCWQPAGEVARVSWMDGSLIAIQRNDGATGAAGASGSAATANDASAAYIVQAWTPGASREAAPTARGTAARIAP